MSQSSSSYLKNIKDLATFQSASLPQGVQLDLNYRRMQPIKREEMKGLDAECEKALIYLVHTHQLRNQAQSRLVAKLKHLVYMQLKKPDVHALTSKFSMLHQALAGKTIFPHRDEVVKHYAVLSHVPPHDKEQKNFGLGFPVSVPK